MRFLCRIGWHDWPKWEVRTSISTIVKTGQKINTIFQTRVCKHCGFREDRDL